MGTRETSSNATRTPYVFLLCHGCGTRAHTADRYCRRCGKALFAQTAPERAPATAGRKVRRALVVTALAALLLALGGESLRHPPDRAQMAGVHIGDSPAKVTAILGQPAKPAQRLLWKADHQVVMWQYDPDPEAGDIPNLSVTFVDGQVWRIAALHNRYTTRDGLRVGDDLAKARQLYGTGIEEDVENGLVPWKFVVEGQIVKVIVAQDESEVLAVGLETPRNLRLVAPPPWEEPEDDPEPALPGDEV